MDNAGAQRTRPLYVALDVGAFDAPVARSTARDAVALDHRPAGSRGHTELLDLARDPREATPIAAGDLAPFGPAILVEAVTRRP